MTIVVFIGMGVLLLGIGSGFYYTSLPEHNPEKNQPSCENNVEELPEGTCSL
ncbi:MAG: hypothetical protein U9P50_01180 [Patescibacteria group bacterium]|nr:hypothetical protein [Patescibacteria group bacterium]